MSGDNRILTIKEALEVIGQYVGPTVGVSMLPMLKQGRDTIVVRPKTGKLKSLDVALYMRGDDYVLHRVLYPTNDGYVIRGDNCYRDEIVPEEAVIGVLTEFFQGDKHVYCTDTKYLKYARKRIKNYRIRLFFVKINQTIRAAAKKFLKLFGYKRG